MFLTFIPKCRFALSLVISTGILSTLACSRADKSSSQPLTALKNSPELAATFQNYQNKPEHCLNHGGKRSRVILTGFNLFGKAFNISGLVPMSMSKPAFWPDSVSLDQLTPDPLQLSQFARHEELVTESGALLRQRTLVINAKEYDVCFLYLDVQWDLAAAIILHESQSFQPDLIIMSGMNGDEPLHTTWETGAINLVSSKSGYNQSGAIDAENAPETPLSKILDTDPLSQKIPLSWDAERLASLNAPLIATIAPHYGSVKGFARAGNNYVCNNVSYIVMRGLSGHAVGLASDLIRFPAMSIPNVKIGFLHYPSSSSLAGMADQGLALFRWNQVLAQSIDASLNP